MTNLINALTIFISAFLLFLVQPMLAKSILPWFGGAAAVWTTCLLFFQTALLLGYLYSHGSIRHLNFRAQFILHLSLLIISLLFLPIIPPLGWKPLGHEDPIGRILALLLFTVGLPYFLLSTTGPLVQAWIARRQGTIPYRLYALSNLGSMLGLLCYPFLIEPFITLRAQLLSWSAGYLIFALFCGYTAFASQKRTSEEVVTMAIAPEIQTVPPLSLSLQLSWLIFAALPSALLLAVTNHLSQNLAAIPFLWILPLSLYLLSFIICFGRPQWYNPQLYGWGLVAALSLMTYALLRVEAIARLSVLIPIFTVGFFVCCLFFNGELVLRKPAPAHLTSFYLMISLGGALGALAVGMAAPLMFTGFFELPLIIAACGLLALIMNFQKHWISDLIWAGVAAGLCTAAGIEIHGTMSSAKVLARNFYGSLRIIDTIEKDPQTSRRMLVHGVINHGTQFLSPGFRREPTSYFGPDSGAARAILSNKSSGLRVGIVGLGAGTLAVYGKPGDYFRFYEINPSVIQLAQQEFSFIRDCPARVEVVPGDARLSLEREPEEHFDVLVIDAFSGDSIPVHLLTREAFAIYFRHLKPQGILTLHLSNQYLDLPPVVRKVGESYGWTSCVVTTRPFLEKGLSWSVWIMLASQPQTLQLVGASTDEIPVISRPVSLWKDDYSNQFQILKF
jgi:hypothetical protein